MRLAGKIAYSTLATGVSIIGGLARNKIFASFLSLGLFGILSIGQQSSSLLFTIMAFGLPLGMTTLAADTLVESEPSRNRTISRMIALAYAVSLGAFLVVALVMLLEPDAAAFLVTGNRAYSLPIALILLSAPLMVGEYCLNAIMEGMGKVREIVLFRMVPVVLVLPAVYVLTSTYGLEGAGMGVVLNELLLLVFGTVLLRKHLVMDRSSLAVGEVFGRVVKVALLSFGVGAAWMATDFAVKRYMLGTLGEESNGIIQSVAKVTDLYPNIALSWLAMHLFPAVTTAGNDRRATAAAIVRTVGAAVSIIVPIIIILFAFRGTILEIIYRKEFTVAVDYFGAMLTGGVPKVVSWVLALALLPLGLKRQWFWSAMLFTVSYLAIIWAGVAGGCGMYAIPIASGAALCIQVAYVLIVYRRNKVPMGRSFMYQLAGFGGITVLLVAAVFWLPALLGVTVLFAIMAFRLGLLSDILDWINDLRAKTAA